MRAKISDPAVMGVIATAEVEVPVTQLLSRCKSFDNQQLVAHHHSKSEAYVKMLLS